MSALDDRLAASFGDNSPSDKKKGSDNYSDPRFFKLSSKNFVDRNIGGVDCLATSATIRFIPPVNGPIIFNRTMHSITFPDGHFVKIPCLGDKGQKCPICSYGYSLYKANDQNSRRINKIKEHICNIFVKKEDPPREDGRKHFLFSIPKNVYSAINGMFHPTNEGEMPINVFDLMYGYDLTLILSKEKTSSLSRYPNYSRSSFYRSPSSLVSSDEEAARILSQAIELTDESINTTKYTEDDYAEIIHKFKSSLIAQDQNNDEAFGGNNTATFRPMSVAGFGPTMHSMNESHVAPANIPPANIPQAPMPVSNDGFSYAGDPAYMNQSSPAPQYSQPVTQPAPQYSQPIAQPAQQTMQYNPQNIPQYGQAPHAPQQMTQPAPIPQQVPQQMMQSAPVYQTTSAPAQQRGFAHSSEVVEDLDWLEDEGM